MTIPAGTSPDAPFVQILDPATGTATFLVEVIDVIHRTMTAKWNAAGHSDKKIVELWNEYVPKQLLPRFYGYELLMAPYAIAHMKIGLKLAETGYRFKSGERVRVYLTNTLEPPAQDRQLTIADWCPALAHEAHAVNAIKRDQRFTVVVGNPPYSGHSANQGDWITDLLHSMLSDSSHGYFEVDGKPLNERNPKWLNDDYVKFIRYGQRCIAQGSCGILAMITNHGYFDNPTFRGMRQSLLQSFSTGYLMDLRGNVKKGSAAADDQNVFDIQQGVGVGVWVRRPGSLTHNDLFHADMAGSRTKKYDRLLVETAISTGHGTLHAVSPFYLFIPQSAALSEEFRTYTALADILPVNTMGVTTGRDQLCVSFTAQEAIEKVTQFTSASPEQELATRYGLSNKSGWNIARARRSVRDEGVSRSKCWSFAYRPFDVRVLYAESSIVGRLRLHVMRHMMGQRSLGLCTTRQVNGTFQHVFCTRFPANDCLISLSSGERSYLFPLYLRHDDDGLLAKAKTQANVGTCFMKLMETQRGVGTASENSFAGELTPEAVFNYTYAILHSPGYRIRYVEFLKIDFPRLPLTSSLALFRALAAPRRGPCRPAPS